MSEQIEQGAATIEVGDIAYWVSVVDYPVTGQRHVYLMKGDVAGFRSEELHCHVEDNEELNSP